MCCDGDTADGFLGFDGGFVWFFGIVVTALDGGEEEQPIFQAQ